MSKYNIFSIDTDLPFADTFATGLWIRVNKDPITLRQSMIFVPHRRAARVLEAVSYTHLTLPTNREV